MTLGMMHEVELTPHGQPRHIQATDGTPVAIGPGRQMGDHGHAESGLDALQGGQGGRNGQHGINVP